VIRNAPGAARKAAAGAEHEEADRRGELDELVHRRADDNGTGRLYGEASRRL